MSLKLVGGTDEGKLFLTGKDNKLNDVNLEVYNNKFSIYGKGYRKSEMTIGELIEFCKERNELCSIEKLCSDDIVNFIIRTDYPSLNDNRDEIKQTKDQIHNLQKEIESLQLKQNYLEKQQKDIVVDVFKKEILNIQRINGEIKDDELENILKEMIKEIAR